MEKINEDSCGWHVLMSRGALHNCGRNCVTAAQFLLQLSNLNIRILVTMLSQAKISSLSCVQKFTGVYYFLLLFPITVKFRAPHYEMDRDIEKQVVFANSVSSRWG